MKKIAIILILILIPITVLAQTETEFDIEALENLFLNTETTPSTVVSKFDLIWSTDTYTPFDYPGRNLPVQGSRVTVNALVSASGGSAKDLKYSWFVEDIFQKTKSGYGKDSFYFYVNQIQGVYPTIRCQVFNDDRTVFEEKSIKIPTTNPEVVIYSSNGNSHFSNQASTASVIFADKKFSFIAKPYFFSIKKLTDLIFKWNLPGKESIISSDYNASILDLTIANKQISDSTQSEIHINVENGLDNSQKAGQSIKINIY